MRHFCFRVVMSGHIICCKVLDSERLDFSTLFLYTCHRDAMYIQEAITVVKGNLSVDVE